MDRTISGTFRMIVRGGSPYQLFLDDDFLNIMGISDNSDPEENYRTRRNIPAACTSWRQSRQPAHLLG